MADHSKPLITSSYANFVSELDGRFDDLTLGLDPATTSPTNLPTGAIRWNSASYKWEKWSGSAWSDLSAYYNINLAGPLTLTANSSSDALRITQTGAGNALVVEDSANPDSTPFVVSGTGDVGVGTTSPAYKLDVVGTASVSSNMLVGGTLGITGVTTFSSNPVYSAGTANGVVYLNGSKVATTGSALTFDGSLFSNEKTQNYQYRALFNSTNYCDFGYFGTNTVAPSNPFRSWYLNGSEQMRLTSTGLGIGTSSITRKLTVLGSGIFTDGTNDVTIWNDGSIGTNASVNLKLLTGGSTKATLDTSGNLGLGVTPKGWDAGWSAIDFGGNSIISGNSTMSVALNAYRAGTNWIYKNTAAASNYYQGSGAHYWYTAPSGTAGNAISFTQAMTLDASGNLGIGLGATSPSYSVDIRNSVSTALRVGSTSNSFGTLLSWDNAGGVGKLATLGTYALTFGINSTEQMRIDYTGNVGIGTSSPQYKLHVETGTDGYVGYVSGAINYRTLIYNSGSTVYTGTWSSTPLAFNTNGTERMRIDSSGNVGIGTSSPGYTLQVGGGSADTRILVNSNDSYGIGFKNTANTIGGWIGSPAAQTLAFFSYAGSERMRIDSSGNVGIGTSSPSGRLHVSGTSSDIWLTDTAGTANTWRILAKDGTTTNAFRIYDQTASTERMRIDSSGNLLFNSGYGSAATAYGCRSWVNFNGTGTVAIRASGNVSSITDGGTGAYTVNFSTAMPDANYSIEVTTRGDTNGCLACISNSTAPTTTASYVQTRNQNGTLSDRDYVCVAIFR